MKLEINLETKPENIADVYNALIKLGCCDNVTWSVLDDTKEKEPTSAATFTGTIDEYAKKYAENGWLDIDVTDKDIDMMVAFVYDSTEEPVEYYDKFLHLLAKNVKVEWVNESVMNCDFSGFFRPLNDSLNEMVEKYGWQSIEFDDPDETYYDFVLWLENLISGNSSEKTYEKLYNGLTHALEKTAK